MKLTRQVLIALVLAAGAASLVQADARPRGGKHAPNIGRPVGVQQPAGAGAAVKGRGNPSPAGRESPTFTKKNAIGATSLPAGIGPPVAGPGAFPGTGASGAVKVNAIGARPGTVGSLPRAPAGAAKIGPAASPATGVRPAAPALSVHGGGISGTGMTRPGTAPGVVGGPAKLAGGISGTGMRPKR
jgi:hypothetical protein